jgi:hypothetical protein
MLAPLIEGQNREIDMSFRTKACAVTVAAACALFAPAAMAAPVTAHAPAPVTGKQLKNGLLPPSHFLPGYATLFADNSGGSLEHTTVFHISSMKCFEFWTFIGGARGFGETAFAEESAAAKSPSASVQEVFHQAVYQAASTRAAATMFAKIGAKYKSCKTVSAKDGKGGTLKQTVHARVAEKVGGHQSLLLTENITDTKTPGPPLVIVALWTLDGTDVYLISSELLSVHAPKPTLTSLMLKLIPRVRALK